MALAEKAKYAYTVMVALEHEFGATREFSIVMLIGLGFTRINFKNVSITCTLILQACSFSKLSSDIFRPNFFFALVHGIIEKVWTLFKLMLDFLIFVKKQQQQNLKIRMPKGQNSLIDHKIP